jgi:hypothetical protein
LLKLELGFATLGMVVPGLMGFTVPEEEEEEETGLERRLLVEETGLEPEEQRLQPLPELPIPLLLLSKLLLLLPSRLFEFELRRASARAEIRSLTL